MGVLEIHTHFSFLTIQELGQFPVISTMVCNKSIENSPLTIST